MGTTRLDLKDVCHAPENSKFVVNIAITTQFKTWVNLAWTYIPHFSDLISRDLTGFS
jgi:hypothetical protein